jgi:hypothetical protein
MEIKGSIDTLDIINGLKTVTMSSFPQCVGRESKWLKALEWMPDKGLRT